ncbi:hypothetical protein [Candidatus Methylomicrobium oryzae]|uniref:hypothetical protein n=1 Tax=Candidatus Methylomicrobium oryzae TaxID=2802053 RepID=UPI001921AD4B|nr:hypothetical protein [Methylomicrobium sp. RS1]MBL1264158.1 hypothetical protein [Methylomicrobium sp. RS1]
MSSKESELKAELLTVFTAFRESHNELIACLNDDSAYPVWIQQIDGDHAATRNMLRNIVLNWSYTDDGQEPGTTIQYNGLAPCSMSTYLTINKVNECRDLLHKQLMKMDSLEGELEISELEDEDDNRDRLSKRAMTRLGYPRFNRRQACRKFIALPYPVLSAGFFWNRYRKTIKLDRSEVQARLDKLLQRSWAEHDAIYHELERFHAIDDGCLVQVFPESIHRRVNLYVNQNGVEKRIQRYAHTPIFYVCRSNAPLPPKTLLPDEPSAKECRLAKRNITIECEPYLPLLNLYRLLPKYRG